MKSFNPNDEVILRAKTHKAKNKIRQWGNRWIVRRLEKWGVLLVAESDKSGDENNLPNSVRWVHLPTDVDYEIVS